MYHPEDDSDDVVLFMMFHYWGKNPNADKLATASAAWRSDLSKVEVWYATYGSNLCRSRFLRYIEGGQVKIKLHNTKKFPFIYFLRSYIVVNWC